MRRRVPSLLAIAVLTLAVLVVAHDLAFLLAYGSRYEVALARTGHDGRWDETVRIVLGAAVLLGVAATARLVHLAVLVRRLGATGGVRGPSARLTARSFLACWSELFVGATSLFVLQENAERLGAGLPLPGLAVLGPAAPQGPLAVLLLVSLLVAVVTTLFRVGIAALKAPLAEHRACPASHGDPPPPRPREPVGGSTSVLGGKLAGRAPPVDLPS